MKRLKLFMGPGNSQAELNELTSLVRKEVDEAAQKTAGFDVHDYKVTASDDVSGSLDGAEGYVSSRTTVIVGVVYSIKEENE